ncbi:YbaB/EbfC family nucleoid-associated protein [Nonomuraea sp. NN258]|uniref:YbaB/EbfC family nucleoid-associated protein n=1 Tax=Nonomuraea antri TaxID=2730852 RepID=UPI00156835EB|nr:YbaB/EbfC family nucleoid-associated protein [Nonomuraea antri]NRQ40802.1 YbaB/EbfC family nucleoid-associated protein [Nonomuraea antri]
MADVFRATIEELAGEYNRQIDRVREAYGKLNELETTVRSGDGMIGVTMGPRGQVRAIELNPRVYQRLSPSELAEAITEQIHRGAALVTERTKELVGPLMPDGLPYEELFGEDVRLDSFLPGHVEPDE